jgi:hypothetical protein
VFSLSKPVVEYLEIHFAHGSCQEGTETTQDAKEACCKKRRDSEQMYHPIATVLQDISEWSLTSAQGKACGLKRDVIALEKQMP